jgi:small multidrug resistance pump
MLGLSPSAIGLFFLAIIAQTIGISFIPRSQGFTNIGGTLALVAMYVITLAAVAQLIHRGVNLSVLIPLVSAFGPLTAIAIGVLLYGEDAQPQKIIMLVSACGLIGFASR